MGLTGAIVMSVGLAYVQSENGKTQANYKKRIAESNAVVANMEADQVIKKGEEDAAKYGRKVKSVIGAQRAAFAGAGVAVDTGTAGDIATETEMIGLEDAKNIRNNAYLQAFGLKSAALNYNAEGQAGVDAADTNAKYGLMAGALNGVAMGGGFSSSKSTPSSPSSKPTTSNGSSYNPPTGKSYLGSDRFKW